MDKERKELAERKSRLKEIFDETKALREYYSEEELQAARQDAKAAAREAVVNAFRRFHQRHHMRLRRRELLDIFIEEANRMS